MEYDGKRKVTKREKFLKRLDGLVPWEALEAEVEPHYPKPRPCSELP